MKRTIFFVPWVRVGDGDGWRTTFQGRAWYAHGLEQGGTGKIVAFALYLGEHLDHTAMFVYQGSLTECSSFIRGYDSYLERKKLRAAKKLLKKK